MPPKPNAAAPANPRRAPEFFLAVALTGLVVLLHIYFLKSIGGLWRDEVNSVNVAQGTWSQLTHDSFPILFPLLLRGWSSLGFGASDLSLRIFGVLAGLSLTAAFWLAAWWLRRRPPLWSLVLAALNAWVIYYDASLRAYGLGSAMIALCFGAAWFFLEKPGRKSWLLFAATAILSVQTLYQNTALVAAVCAGACAVGARRKNFRLALGIFLGGLAAAVSLLPYWLNVSGMAQSASPLRMDFDRVIALNNLGTLLAFPLPQFFWVWPGLVGWVLVRAAANFFSPRRDDRPLFAAVAVIIGLCAFVVFLRLANFPVQPWYFLPLLALTAVALESSLPRLEGKFRAALWGGVAATALMSALFAVRLLDYRFTNVDALAKKILASAHKKDFAVVTPWQFGITFGHCFKNSCAWDTAPPLADHSVHRFDLAVAQMQNTNAMAPLLAQLADTLRAGHTVWVVGGIGEAGGPNVPASPPPPPLPATGWNETPYRFAWSSQLNWFLRRHSLEISCVDAGTNDDVNFIERTSLFTAKGWKGPQ